MRANGKRKWGLALLNFIAPLIDDEYSYEQIVMILNEKYNFDLTRKQLADISFYYKERKSKKVVTVAGKTQIGESKNDEGFNEKVGQSEDEHLEILTKKMLSEDNDSSNFADYQKEIKAKLKW